MFFGIFDKRDSNPNNRASISNPKFWNTLAGHSSESHSGEIVTDVAAMEITAFASALNAVADAFAQLPIHVTKKKKGASVEDDASPEAIILRDRVNDADLTPFDWLKGMINHYYTKGRAASLIERALNGTILNIWELNPDNLKTELREVAGVDGVVRQRRIYKYTDSAGKVHEYDSSVIIDLVRLPDPSTNRPSPVTLNRHTIGLAIAAEKYAARALKSGFLPTQLKCSLPPEQVSGEVLEAAYHAAIDAVKRSKEADSWFIGMPPGFELATIGVNPSDLQLLDLRKFLIIEIARVFNLPPVFLQDLSTGTYSNTEQQAQVLVKHTLMPIIRQLEAQLNLKVAGKNQSIRFNVDGFLRADYATRMEGHRTGVQGGFLTPNEARELEGRAPLEGGDQLFVQQATVPLNMASDLAAATIKKSNEPAPAPQPTTTQEPVEPVKEDAQ